jgi:hypothetical protein
MTTPDFNCDFPAQSHAAHCLFRLKKAKARRAG